MDGVRDRSRLEGVNGFDGKMVLPRKHIELYDCRQFVYISRTAVPLASLFPMPMHRLDCLNVVCLSMSCLC